MAELSFGKIYCIPALGDARDVPKVSLSYLTGTVGVAEILLSGKIDAIYMSDDEGEREFAIWNGENLFEYDVILGYGTGTVSIVTGSVTAAPADVAMGYFDPFGLKKESNTLYRAYYSDDGSDGATFNVHKVVISVGVGIVSDTIILTSHKSVVGEYYISSGKIGHRQYFSFTHRLKPVAVGFTLNIYSIDIETGAVAHFANFTKNDGDVVPIGDAGTSYFYYGEGIPIVSSAGIPMWCLGYTEVVARRYPPLYDWIYYHMVINGVDVVVEDHEAYSSPSVWDDVSNAGNNYNSNNCFLVCYHMQYPTVTWRAISFSGGTISYTAYPPTYPVLPLDPAPALISKHTFPAVGRDPDNSVIKIWIDPATGEETSIIDPIGLTYIRCILPTLDALSGNVYMFARFDDFSQKLIAVQPNTNTIEQEWVVWPSKLNPVGAVNHGNFILVAGTVIGGGSGHEMMYLENINPPIKHRMIIETN